MQAVFVYNSQLLLPTGQMKIQTIAAHHVSFTAGMGVTAYLANWCAMEITTVLMGLMSMTVTTIYHIVTATLNLNFR